MDLGRGGEQQGQRLGPRPWYMEMLTEGFFKCGVCYIYIEIIYSDI